MTYQPMTQMRGQSNIRFVLIPELESRARKGSTKYDGWFENCIENAEAIQIPFDEFDAVRKAAFRFISFRKLNLSIRQKKDSRTKTYILWFQEKETLELPVVTLPLELQ